MEAEAIDANLDEEVEGQESSSEAVELKPKRFDDGTISTIEMEPVEPEIDTDTSDGAEQNTSKDQSKEKDTAEKKTPYHEDPAWKRIISERDENARRLAELEKKLEEKEAKPKAPTYKNLMEMDKEELAAKMLEEPHEVLAMFAQQFEHEFVEKITKQQDQLTQKQRDEQIQEKTRAFFAEREDALEMLKDGSIEKYIRENPEHTPISAYHVLSEESRAKAAADKAIEEFKKEFYKQQKAAGNAGNKAGAGAPKKASTANPEAKKASSVEELKRVMLKRLK